MSLLNPVALLFGLSIGVVLLLHFRRPRRIERVPSLQLWQAGGESATKRPVLESVRRNLQLLLQILFLALLTLALARPAFRHWGTAPRSVVIVMDCTASMMARERPGARFDLARAKAAALVDDLGASDRVFLVQARPQPVLNSFARSDERSVRSALSSLSPAEAHADLAGAVTLALSSIPPGEPGEVVVFSDGTRGAQLAGLPVSGRIRYIQTGETGNNVAITRLSVRSNPFSSHDRQVYAEVANFSDRRQDFRFELSLDGVSLLREDAGLGGNGKRSFAVDAPPDREGVLRAEIDVRDDLDTDNRAHAVLNAARMSVLLVTEGNLFLEKALEVDPQVSATLKRPREFSPEDLRREYDAIILDGYEPPGLPPANYFVTTHPSDTRSGRAAALRSLGSVVSPRPRHPVMSFVDLSDVSVNTAVAVDVPTSGVVLMEGAGRPLLVVSDNGAFRRVDLGFDVRASNLPLTPAFPVLFSNVLRWLGGDNDDPGHQVAAGGVFRWRVPAREAGEAEVTTPAGRSVRTATADGVLTFALTETAGIYTAQCGGAATRFAVSLLDERESDIRPLSGPRDDGMPSAASTREAPSDRETWPWLLLAALVALLLEWRRLSQARRQADASASPRDKRVRGDSPVRGGPFRGSPTSVLRRCGESIGRALRKQRSADPGSATRARGAPCDS